MVESADTNADVETVDPFPERLSGRRVELEIWHETHAEAFSVAVANSLEELRPFMPWAATEPLSPAERRALIAQRRREWAAGGDGFYTVLLEGRVIGACGLHRRGAPGEVDVGYWIDSDHTGRGLAAEAAELLTAAALARPDVDSVAIHHERTNPASGRVAAKAGFVFAAQRPTPDPAPASDGIEWVWRAMTLPGFTIRPEEPADAVSIAAVVEAAFGSPVEARLVSDIRTSPGYRPDLALVAEIDRPDGDGRRIVGHVMISDAVVRTDDGDEHPIAMLSPLAVAPDAHRRGVGAALVRAAVDRADAAGEPMVVLEGSPAYYGRFGFEPAVDHGLALPLPDWAPIEAGQVLWFGGHDPRLTGTVVYPPAFDGLA